MVNRNSAFVYVVVALLAGWFFGMYQKGAETGDLSHRIYRGLTAECRAQVERAADDVGAAIHAVHGRGD